jgi:hypothetical protein
MWNGQQANGGRRRTTPDAASGNRKREARGAPSQFPVELRLGHADRLGMRDGFLRHSTFTESICSTAMRSSTRRSCRVSTLPGGAASGVALRNKLDKAGLLRAQPRHGTRGHGAYP